MIDWFMLLVLRALATVLTVVEQASDIDWLPSDDSDDDNGGVNRLVAAAAAAATDDDDTVLNIDVQDSPVVGASLVQVVTSFPPATPSKVRRWFELKWFLEDLAEHCQYALSLLHSQSLKWYICVTYKKLSKTISRVNPFMYCWSADTIQTCSCHNMFNLHLF